MESLARDARRLVPRSLAPAHGGPREGDPGGGARHPAGAGAGPGRGPQRRRAARRRRCPRWRARPRRRWSSPRAAGQRGRGPAGRAPARPRRPLRPRADRRARGLSRRASRASTTPSSPASLDKIPVVLDDPRRAEARTAATCPATGRRPARAAAARSRDVIRTELFRNGRVVDHRTIDYRSPVFGVASLVVLARGHRHRRHLARGLARGARRPHAHAAAPRRVRPRDAPPDPGRRPRTPDRHEGAADEARRAIISVYRKEGIVDLARGLVARGFEIVSTGGTAAGAAPRRGVKVTSISDVTGLPGDPRRPREDAAPEDPRRHPGPARRARARAGARASTASRPSTSWW